MDLVTVKSTDNQVAAAWFVKYPLDFHALGPYRFDRLVPATIAIERALGQFGERPCEVWPSGYAEEVVEYEIELDEPENWQSDGRSLEIL